MKISRYSPEQRSDRALQMIEHNALLKEAFTLEPRLHDVLGDIIALLSVENRDLAYITFRERCSTLVGYQAIKPELQTSSHYTQMMHLIVTLLDWVAIDDQPARKQESEEDIPDPLILAVEQSLEASREATLKAIQVPPDPSQRPHH